MTPAPGPVSLRRASRPRAKKPRTETPDETQAGDRRLLRRPGPRGWAGRGGGAADLLQVPGPWRATTVQVCGLYPFILGTGSPQIGVPLGAHLLTGESVCADPISWFTRAKLIANPSVFVLGKPGLGKSTTIRRMMLGLAAYGTIPLVLGDLKPDYVDLIEALDGQVIRLGRGVGALNVLDPGESAAVAARLTGQFREQVEADARARRLQLVRALIQIVRKARLGVEEDNVLARAITMAVDRRGVTPPVLGDVLHLVHTGPNELRDAANDRGSEARYFDTVRLLEASLSALTSPDGPVGDMFAKPTAVAMHRDRPVAFDVSAIADTDSDLQGAALLACWSTGFGAVAGHHVLADAGLEERRHYFVVMDELWRALRSGPAMVDRIDALTRLNRTDGVGQAMCTHTISDLMSLTSESERQKAAGFVERAGMVIVAGLPGKELPLLAAAGVNLTGKEQALITSWSAPSTFNVAGGAHSAPPGLGKILIKVGSRPGIPVQVRLVDSERALHNTNKRWQ